MNKNKNEFRRAGLYAFAALFFGVAFCAHAFAASEGSFHRIISVTGAVNLDIATGSGNVNVRTGGGNQVQITGHIRAGSWMGDSAEAEGKVKKLEANPPIQQSGNDIRIGHIDDPELRHNVSISYEVVVPENTQLHSHTGSGDQQIDGLHGMVEVGSGSGRLTVSDIGDSVRAEAGSGDVEIHDVKGNLHAKTGSGTIHAVQIAGGFEGETGSGNITLEQVSEGSVRAHTGSGDLELHILRGSLDAQTGSGTISVDGDPTGAWTLHTGSGDVHLKLTAAASFDLDARTSSGELSVNQPITVLGTIGKKEIRGKVRGGGVPVNVETGSGDIRVQ
ncbi:MAG TPA: DUF4097 family beta strand repeat-containing protein [Terriglobales bacterium]|jgi:DUF4097 and DUF4098 domain-containing protein YvlB